MNRRQWLLLGCALLLLGLVKLGVIAWYLLRQPAERPVVTVNCAAQSSACKLPGGRTLYFIDPLSETRPFVLALDGPVAAEPSAAFAMRSMDMGFNRYRFVRAHGRWQARIMLPACVTGRHDWEMTLEVDGERLQIPLQIH